MFFGTVSGGLSAEPTGGNFWQGAAIGLVVSGLNHVAHKMSEPKNEQIKLIYDKENDKISEVKTKNSDFIYQKKLNKKIEAYVLSEDIGGFD